MKMKNLSISIALFSLGWTNLVNAQGDVLPLGGGMMEGTDGSDFIFEPLDGYVDDNGSGSGYSGYDSGYDSDDENGYDSDYGSVGDGYGGDVGLDSLFLDEALMETGMVLLGECQVDLESMMNTAQEAMTFTGSAEDFNTIFGYLDVIGNKCPADKKKDFEDALDSFETCSGYNLMEVVETLPSAILGTEMMCVRSVLQQHTAEDSEEPVVVSEDCAVAMFGTNPLGTLVRSLYMRPDHTLPCFQALSKAVPDCTLAAWPMPVVGSWLKTTSCLVGAVAPFLDDMCQAEWDVLDSCLPAAGEIACDTATDECVEQGSSMFTLSPPLFGIPVSDACRRVADTQGISTVLDRYERTVEKCIDVWPGWKENDSSNSASDMDYSILGAAASPETPKKLPAVQQASVTAVKKIEPVVPIEATFVVSEKVVDNDSQSQFPMFLTGLGSGFAIVGLAWALMVRTRKEKGRRRGFKSVEMVENQNELSLV